MTVTVRIDGLRELGERMRKLSNEVANKAARSATAAGARLVKDQAKQNLVAKPSVDTRLVHDNVIIKKLGKRDSQYTSEHIVTVRKRAYPGDSERTARKVASFLEFGTVKMDSESFLKPAFDKRKEAAALAIADRLKKAIDKAGG